MAQRRSPRLSAPNSPSFPSLEVAGDEETGEAGGNGGAGRATGETMGERGEGGQTSMSLVEGGDVTSAGDGTGGDNGERTVGENGSPIGHPLGDSTLQDPESPRHTSAIRADLLRVPPFAVGEPTTGQAVTPFPARLRPTSPGPSVSSRGLSRTIADLFPHSSSPPSPVSPPTALTVGDNVLAVSRQPNGDDGEGGEHRADEERRGDEGTWSSGDGQYHGLRSLELETEEANKRASRKLPPEEVSVWRTAR